MPRSCRRPSASAAVAMLLRRGHPLCPVASAHFASEFETARLAQAGGECREIKRSSRHRQPASRPTAVLRYRLNTVSALPLMFATQTLGPS
ncbi:hypothetical protein [Lysobacter gummosus]|uniref:hypothetical protein n=1 Tax=Lysobacter gummosus TaxID=262324 RepID=UPI0036306671